MARDTEKSMRRKEKAKKVYIEYKGQYRKKQKKTKKQSNFLYYTKLS